MYRLLQKTWKQGNMACWGVLFKNTFRFLFFVSFYVCVCSVHVGAPAGQKRVLSPLELEWQAVVSCPPWVLGTELESSGSTASILNH